jgi:hypothetical protein
VPDEKGIYLSDIVVTSYHAVLESGLQKGDTIGIWGTFVRVLLVVNGLHADSVLLSRPGSHLRALLPVGENLRCRQHNRYRQRPAPTRSRPLQIRCRDDQLERIQGCPWEDQEVCGPDGIDRAIDATGNRYRKSVLQKLSRAVGACE